MAVDSASSYKAATSQADLQFIKDGWELDDAESAELHNSTKDTLTFLFDMVRKYELPGDYALNKEAVENYVSWSSKPDSQLVNKVAWLEGHQSDYSEFGPYWLELAKDYYKSGEYSKCLDSIGRYESVTTRIFRKNIDYANVLPMAIISAKETMTNEEYVKTADNYCTIILANTKDDDWTLRFFTAQIYMDIYAITKDATYLKKAYKTTYDNVVVLVDGQKKMNEAYLKEVKEEKAKKDATKREKEEIKSYNKTIKEERKTALPPVSEALYLNCDLLFALAEECNITPSDKMTIEELLHENGENIFLTQVLDARFRFNDIEQIKANDIKMTFDGKSLTIPAVCVSDRSVLTVTVTGPDGSTTIDDWIVDKVTRPKDASVSDFEVIFRSKTGKDYKYQAGENVTIKIIPVMESPEECFEMDYKVIETKIAFVFKGIAFERVTG